MSTRMFATTTATVPSSTIPMITGWSCWSMATMAVRPMPSMENTVSVTITPPSSVATSMPNWVTTGDNALRRPWRTTTRCSEIPFDRAVRM